VAEPGSQAVAGDLGGPPPVASAVDRVLDCRGVSCPMPVLRTAQAIKTIGLGQVLEVIATDPGIEPDMRAWCGQTGNDLLTIDKQGDAFHVLIRRAR
jgi:tRNA 2-thiouridine synthesizing protein A